MSFVNKVVLITGAATGIGASCAREFLQRGALLSLVDIAEPADDSGLEHALWTRGDVADPNVQKIAVRRTLDIYGRIDILVNNVGVGIYGGAVETPEELVRRMFDINVFAAVGLTGLVIPHMRSQRSGAVVNVSSISAYVPTPWNTMYCASKSALHSFSRGLRREVSHDGIHVLTLVPGIVRTRFREHVLAGEPPAGVLKIRFAVAADGVAASIAEGLRKRKSLIFVPIWGLLFYAVDLLLTPVMDWAIQRWHPPAPSPSTPDKS